MSPRKMKPVVSAALAAIIAAAVLFLIVPTLTRAQSQDPQARALKSKVTPAYPEMARKLNLAGTVKIQVTIAPNGSVKDTKVMGGHPLLINAAEDAIKKWKYEPAPQETNTIVEIKFNPGM